MRIVDHPILGKAEEKEIIEIAVDGKIIHALEGEPIAMALLAAGLKTLRTTAKRHEPRGLFCCIGRCTDCVMIVDGMPNVCTCVTAVKKGMKIQTQHGLGMDTKEFLPEGEK